MRLSTSKAVSVATSELQQPTVSLQPRLAPSLLSVHSLIQQTFPVPGTLPGFRDTPVNKTREVCLRGVYMLRSQRDDKGSSDKYGNTRGQDGERGWFPGKDFAAGREPAGGSQLCSGRENLL